MLAFALTLTPRVTALNGPKNEEPAVCSGFLRWNGAPSNPQARLELARLADLCGQLRDSAGRNPRSPRSVPGRPSPVLETVTRVLEDAGPASESTRHPPCGRAASWPAGSPCVGTCGLVGIRNRRRPAVPADPPGFVRAEETEGRHGAGRSGENRPAPSPWPPRGARRRSSFRPATSWDRRHSR
jgi:hypothetical protein